MFFFQLHNGKTQGGDTAAPIVGRKQNMIQTKWISRLVENIFTPLVVQKICGMCLLRHSLEDIFYFNFETGDSIWDHPCDLRFKVARQKSYRLDGSMNIYAFPFLGPAVQDQSPVPLYPDHSYLQSRSIGRRPSYGNRFTLNMFIN